MAMEINIRITVDGDTEYSATEAAVVRSLAAHPSQGTAAVVVTDWPPADRQEVKVEAPATAPSPAAKKPATRAPKAAAVKTPPPADVPMALEPDTAPEAEADEVEASVAQVIKTPTGQITQAAGVKLDQPASRDLSGAITIATELVGKGKSAVVKSALEAAGAKKVSNMETAEALASFFAVLEG